ncbi:MAG: LysM peptidoglycan-binding domain-containing protein [Cellulosilyticaceae bacterium]
MARKKNKMIYLQGQKRRRRGDAGAVVGAVVAICLCGGIGLTMLPNAYRITIEDEEIGIVQKKEYIDSALETVQVQLEKQYNTEVQIEPIENIKKVRASKKDLIDPNKLPAHFRNLLDIKLQVQEFFIDDELIGIIESKEQLDLLKTELKKKYYDDTNVKADFSSEIKLVPVFAQEEEIMTFDELVATCTKRQKKIITYEVQPGDSLWGIASKLGVNITDVLKANEGMTEKTPLRIGQELNVEVRKPLLGLTLIELPTSQVKAD